MDKNAEKITYVEFYKTHVAVRPIPSAECFRFGVDTVQKPDRQAYRALPIIAAAHGKNRNNGCCPEPLQKIFGYRLEKVQSGGILIKQHG